MFGWQAVSNFEKKKSPAGHVFDFSLPYFPGTYYHTAYHAAIHILVYSESSVNINLILLQKLKRVGQGDSPLVPLFPLVVPAFSASVLQLT
jgi:hypothetical protein